MLRSPVNTNKPYGFNPGVLGGGGIWISPPSTWQAPGSDEASGPPRAFARDHSAPARSPKRCGEKGPGMRIETQSSRIGGGPPAIGARPLTNLWGRVPDRKKEALFVTSLLEDLGVVFLVAGRGDPLWFTGNQKNIHLGSRTLLVLPSPPSPPLPSPPLLLIPLGAF